MAATPATADFHAVNGRIAYERVGHIWLTNQDGSDQRNVAAGNQPAWSADGTRIAFLDNGGLCTAAIGGADVARLTWTPITTQPPGRPAWQPLPAGSTPAGLPGRSVGPPPGYPRGTPWHPSCDRPDDHVTMSTSGPAFALLGSLVRYTLTLKNEGNAPILVTLADRLHGGVPAAGSPSQGRCDRFSRRTGAWITECMLGGLLPGDVATIVLPVRSSRVGTLENAGLRSLDSSGTQVQTGTTRTDVVRCSLRGRRGPTACTARGAPTSSAGSQATTASRCAAAARTRSSAALAATRCSPTPATGSRPTARSSPLIRLGSARAAGDGGVLDPGRPTASTVERSGFGHKAPGYDSRMAVTARPKLDAYTLRRDFPIFEHPIHGKPLSYLDSASSSQKPRQVLDAVREFYETSYANVHRGVYDLAERATAALRGGAREDARAVNAPTTREVIFTRNATQALNLVAYAWGLDNLGPGDVVVVTELEHHANFVPWQQIAKRTGAEFRVISIDDSGELRSTVWTRSRATAGEGRRREPRLELARHDQPDRAAHRLGARPGRDRGGRRRAGRPAPARGRTGARLRLPRLPSHKLCGPTGAGALYGRRELLERMSPFEMGGEMIRKVSIEETTWNDLPTSSRPGRPPSSKRSAWAPRSTTSRRSASRRSRSTSMRWRCR